MKTARAIIGMALGLSCSALVTPQSNQHGQSRVTLSQIRDVTVRPGHPSPVTFTFQIEEGFHINSSKPTLEELIPTRLSFLAPADLVVAKIHYPAGVMTSFPFDPGNKLSVYSGDVTIRAVLIAQSSATPGTYTVHGEFRYQACDNNACYPPKKLPLEFNVKVLKNTHRGRG